MQNMQEVRLKIRHCTISEFIYLLNYSSPIKLFGVLQLRTIDRSIQSNKLKFVNLFVLNTKTSE